MKTSIFGTIAGAIGLLVPFLPEQWRVVAAAVASVFTALLGISAKDSEPKK